MAKANRVFPRECTGHSKHSAVATGLEKVSFHSNSKETEVKQFFEDLQDVPELTAKKDVFFVTGD